MHTQLPVIQKIDVIVDNTNFPALYEHLTSDANSLQDKYLGNVEKTTIRHFYDVGFVFKQTNDPSSRKNNSTTAFYHGQLKSLSGL